MKRLLLPLLALAMLAGCKAGDMTPADTITMLQACEARGHLVLTAGGSPLTAGMGQTFFLGSPQMSVSFDGDVDFTRPPGTEAYGPIGDQP